MQQQNYLDANPQQTKADIQGIRQPLADIRERCGLDTTSRPKAGTTLVQHEFDCGTMICRSGLREYDVPVPGDAYDRPA